MFPLWWGNKKVNELCFSDFLTGRTTESPAISLNRIFIHVRFFVQTCKIAFNHHIQRHKRGCLACSNNRKNTKTNRQEIGDDIKPIHVCDAQKNKDDF